MKKKKKTPKKNNKKKALPKGISEEEFISAINNVTKKLAHKFKFGYHNFEDMKSQATIFALECLDKYDKSRPLENFLWTHVRNRLFNYKRDNYQRPDKPCIKCEFHNPKNGPDNFCKKFCKPEECQLYSLWQKRNNNKKNLMSPQYIEEQKIANSEENSFISKIANKEILDIIDNNLPPSERENYLKIKHGERIPRNDLVKLQQEIMIIIKKNGYAEKK